MAIAAWRSRGAAAVPLAAVAGLLLAAVACTSSSDQGEAGDKAPGAGTTPTASSAPPGKFRTLPEPCAALPEDVLAKLLPGSASPSPTEGADGASPSGKATLTFDADRRAGCEWSGDGADPNRYLHVDFERVVSYDPSVSDEEQAEENYLDAAGAADVPSGGSASPGSTGTAGGDGSDGAAGSPPGSADSPRIVSGIGDQAFLEDRLKGDASEPHRDVTVVFRKANVVVRVELREWAPKGGEVPSSSVMQPAVDRAAQALAKRLNEQ